MSEPIDALYDRLGEAFRSGELPRTALRGFGIGEDGLITVRLLRDDPELRRELAELLPVKRFRVIVEPKLTEQPQLDEPRPRSWRVRARAHRQHD